MSRGVYTNVVALIEWIVGHPLIAISSSLLVCSAFLVGLANFQITASARAYMGDTPLARQLADLEETYSEDRSLIVVITTSGETLFTAEILQAIKTFTDTAWGLPTLRRVDSITNFQYSRGDGDDIIVEDLVESPRSMSRQDLQNVQEIARTDPRLVGYLLSADARTAAINMNFTVDFNEFDTLREIESAVDALIRDLLAADQSLAAHKSGYLGVTLGWLHAIEKDARTLYTSVIVIIFAGLCVFFRSISLGMATLLLAVVAAACAAGSTGLFGFVIGAPAAVGILMVFMLALADSIHVVKIALLRVAQGMEKREAIVDSVLFNLRPIVITSVTTAVGFLSFLFSDYEGTRIFGGYVAFGVMVACVLSLTLLPALMSFCKLPVLQKKPAEPGRNPLAEFVIRYPWLPVAAALPMLIGSVHFLRQAEINDNPIHYMQEWTDFRQGLLVVEERLTGSMEIMFELSSGEEEGLSQPEFMRQVESFAAWLRTGERVRFVNVYTDTMKRLNQNLNGGLKDFHKLPESRELAAQYLLLYELSLPYGLDLTHQINLDKSATRVVIVIDDTPTVELLAFLQSVEEWLRNNAPAITVSKPTGSIVQMTILTLETFFSMMYGAAVALLIIGIIVLFTFRSFYPGLLCMIMIFAPLLVSYGVWSVISGLFDLSTAFALCMVIGIVVDNAVHFISKFQHAARELGHELEDSIRFAFHTVGGAIFNNAVVLCCGFGILYFSDFKSNATMGVLTSLSLATALIGTFTLLPALLMLRRRGVVA